MEQLVGNSLDRYQIVALLGEGNTGQVFQAHDVKFLRDVAIKVIHPPVAQQPGFEPRFSQAVRTAIGLRHPGLVKVFDFGEARSLFYVVMEYIPGGTLREALHSLRADRQWIALSEAVRLVRQICLALDYTRRQGAPHRDAGPGQIALKPQPGDDLPYQAVLTDLGLAELRAGGGALPDGISPDALAYFSPEQVKGETLDHRSGIYSAGILLYELALARPPFRIATVADAIRCHTAETPTAPRSIRADLPASLERVILTAIEKDPARRFADAGEMAEALADVLPAAAEVDARPDTRAWAVSLATRLPQFETPGPTRRPEAPQPHTPQSVEVDVSRQRIQLVEKGRVTRSIPMKAGGLRIGRAADNDVVIDQITVSEHHARVEFDGTEYKVVDLNSSSGTYLGGAKLPPGMLEVWPPDKPLRIGRAWLRAERPAQSRLAEGAFVRADGSAIDPSRIRYSADEGRVGVFVEEAQLTVVPGNRATLPLIIFNQGLDDDVFTVSVKGVPDIWMDEALPAIPLAPGAQQEVKLIIRPPRSAQSRAGRRPLTIRVTSQGKPDEVVEVRVSLMIVVYSEFSSDLRPQRIRAGETASVVVHNHGNTPETFRLACVDPGGVLAFDPGEVLLTAAEGQGAAAEFKARLSRPRLFGGARAHGFSARIVSQSGQAQVQAGEVISKGLFPAWTIPVALVVLFALAALAALIPRGTPSTAPTAPVIGKTFSNVAGVNSTLIFTITNPNTAITLTGVAFTDSLPTMPAAMIVANSPNASFSAGCGSPSFAPGPGSGIIAFSNGTLVGGGTCTAAVDVIASAGGTYNNTTSPVTSNEAGAGNAASATLTTGAVAPPSIAKSFSQTSLPAGGVTRLTFTIVNPNLAIALTGVAFTDTFPTTPGAMVVANPPNPSLSAGCGQPVFAPAAGSGFVAFSNGVIPGGQTCTVAVDVTAGTGGTYTNVTSAVVSIEGGAGNTAIGVLTVSAIAPPSMTKVFSPSSIPAGAKSTLTFTITNPNLALSLTGVAFNDAFPANMVVANPPNPSLSAGCGQPGFSPVAGSGSVAFSNGTIAGGDACTVKVDVTASTGGTYANASGAVTSANGGTGNTATAALTVGAVAPPSLTKSFAPGTVTAGMKSTLTFTITNPNAAAALTGVGFSDTFPTTPGAMTVADPLRTSVSTGCGQPTFSAVIGGSSVVFSNGAIAGGGVCIVTVDVTAPAGGAYANTSSAVTSANGGTGNPAAATLAVTAVAPPSATKVFSPSSIPAGAKSTLTFTITNPNLAVALTGVAFSDVFPAGMIVADPPRSSFSAGCGQPAFSPVAGSGSVAFSNGTIAGGGVCVASVDVSAPPGGTYANASGAVTSANGGTGNTATAALTVGAVAPPSLTKSFAPGTVTAGMKSTLTFTITNPNAAAALTGVGFSDTFPTTPGAMQVASPSNANAIGCGSPVFSPAVGSGSVTFSNGTIAGGGVCIVTVDVTASIGGAYTNTSSAVTSANGGTGNPATAIWTVLQPPKSVTIEGPSTGALNTNTAFTATVMNLDATTPITYVWEATGQSQPITRTGATLSDTVVLSWTLTGEQFITVTASNAAGVMSNTHSVMIAFAGAPAFANEDNNFGYRKSVSECPTNKRITPAATGQLFIRSSVPRQTCPVSPGTGPENR